MSHSNIAYVDDSGDDGLPGHFRQPGGPGGASHWLVIGSTVQRTSRDLDMVQCAKAIRARLPAPKQQKPLHFAELDHAQRVMATRELSSQMLRTVGVFAYKPTIPAGVYVEKNQFYHYMCRYLIERLSWLCKDFGRHVPEGDGRVKIVFSRRGGMNYEDFQHYLRTLKQTYDPDVTIHWPVIDIDGVEAVDHGQRFGLQFADIAVSGLRAALEPDRYGKLEPRFAEKLSGRVYSRNGNFLSYGAKLVTNADRFLAYRKAAVHPADLTHWMRIFGE